MPRIMPEPRYFSIPSTVVGGVAFRNEARNCRPCVRSLTQVPLICTHSPAEMLAAWPTMVIRSRLPARLDAQHAEPALLVVEGHALHQASQGFGGTSRRSLWIGWRRHSVGKLWHNCSNRQLMR